MAFVDIFNNRKKLQKLQQEKRRQEFDKSIVNLRNNMLYTCHQLPAETRKGCSLSVPVRMTWNGSISCGA